MKSSSVVLVVAFIALLVGGGLYFYSQEEWPKDEKIYERGDELKDYSDNRNEDEVIMASPEKVELARVWDIEGSAVANRVYSGSDFIHTIIAELPALDQGFYQGWLISEDNESNFINTGKLEENNGSFYLEYRSKEDKSDYNIVAVTLELDDDNLPERRVLQGEFDNQ